VLLVSNFAHLFPNGMLPVCPYFHGIACYQDFLIFIIVAFPKVAPCNSEVLLLIYSSLMVFAKYF